MEEILIEVAEFVNGEKDLTDEEKNAIKDLYNTISTKEINSANIVHYIVLLMKIVNMYKEIPNVNKKDLILLVLKKFIEINIEDPKEEEYLIYFVNNMVPPMIDTMISLDNKEIIIKTENYIKSVCQKIKSKLCCFPVE